MRGALENVFASRKTDIPTAVFVLTDGQVRITASSKFYLALIGLSPGA